MVRVEQLRSEFLNRFPPENISSLSLTHYALGTGDKDSLCNWLEFKTSEIANISGAVSSEHIVFYHKKDGA